MAALINLIPIMTGLVFGIVWIYHLVHWDGQGCDPGEDCGSCPFPCKNNNFQKEEK